MLQQAPHMFWKLPQAALRRRWKMGLLLGYSEHLQSSEVFSSDVNVHNVGSLIIRVGFFGVVMACV